MAKFCFVSMSKKFTDVLTKYQEDDSITDSIENVFSLYQGNDVEKKSALDQAARDYLKIFLLTKISSAVNGDSQNECNGNSESEIKVKLERFISLIIQLSKEKYCTNNLPILLLSDVFETLTLVECEEMFSFVEEHVQTWTSEPFFSTGKNHLLRMCNDILRRLSKSQNTVFCGRIQLFLAQLFPIEEKSALNLNSIFHTENITAYKKNPAEILDEISSDGVEEGELASTPVDYNLYIKFWSLQDFFRNPPQTFTSVGFRAFKSGIQEVLKVFESQKIEFNVKRRKSVTSDNAEVTTQQSDDDLHNYFAKYLTNEKLLNLQINDGSFRRYFLVQVLILFQYLNGVVKFKTTQQVLTDSQSNWVNEITDRVYTILSETPPNGKQFAASVKHILMREENWISWKNESCPSFARVQQKPEIGKENQKKPKPPKRTIGEEYLHNRQAKRINMGSHELTRLWNLHPDNLEACKAENRLKFLPSLEEFFEEAIEQADPEAGIEEKYKLVKQPNFQWRSLRLLARKSHHFFTPSNPPFKALPDYLNSVIDSIAKDKQKANTDMKTDTKIEMKEDPEETVETS